MEKTVPQKLEERIEFLSNATGFHVTVNASSDVDYVARNSDGSPSHSQPFKFEMLIAEEYEFELEINHSLDDEQQDRDQLRWTYDVSLQIRKGDDLLTWDSYHSSMYANMDELEKNLPHDRFVTLGHFIGYPEYVNFEEMDPKELLRKEFNSFSPTTAFNAVMLAEKEKGVKMPPTLDDEIYSAAHRGEVEIVELIADQFIADAAGLSDNIQYLVRIAKKDISQTAEYRAKILNPAISISEKFPDQYEHFEGEGPKKAILFINDLNLSSRSHNDQFYSAVADTGLNVIVFPEINSHAAGEKLETNQIDLIVASKHRLGFDTHFSNVTEGNVPHQITPYISALELKSLLV